MQLVFIGPIGAGAAVVTGLLFGAALKLFGRPSDPPVPAGFHVDILSKPSRGITVSHDR